MTLVNLIDGRLRCHQFAADELVDLPLDRDVDYLTHKRAIEVEVGERILARNRHGDTIVRRVRSITLLLDESPKVFTVSEYLRRIDPD